MIKKVIFDTDPGVDDAIALGLLLKCKNIDLKLVSTVAGNVGLEKTTKNALDLLKLYEREDIDVAMGASKPLIIPYEDASLYHGKDGLGGVKLLESNKKAHKNAISEMKELILNSESKITIIAVGPLTNIALLISAYPETISNIEEIIFMGGAIGRGNKMPLVEYNIGEDPHSAKIVFNSGIKMTMLGLEMGDNARIDKDEVSKIDTKLAKIFTNFLNGYNGNSFEGKLSVYDATAVAYLDDKSIFETEKCFADVEIEGVYTKGATNIDFGKEPNMNVAVKIDTDKFYNWFKSKLILD